MRKVKNNSAMRVLNITAALLLAAAVSDVAGQTFDDDPVVTLNDGDTYYVGQTLQRSLGVVPNETLELYLSGAFQQAIFADDDGFVTFDTDGFDAGLWSLRDTDGNEIAGFRLVDMTLSISFGASEAINAGPAAEVGLSTTSNRDPVIHYFTATLDGSQVDSTILQNVFSGIGDVLDAQTLRIEAGLSMSFTLDFSDTSPGNFILTSDSPDTAAADTASITVKPDLVFRDRFEG